MIPGLVADLKGRVPIKIRIATSILGGRLIKSTVTDVPDLPVGSFTLNLDGGDKGVLESKFDLCLSGSRTARWPPAWTSPRTAARRPRRSRESRSTGCGPAATASLRRPAGRRGVLKVTVERHPDGKNISAMTIRLPRGTKLVRSKVRGSVVSADGAKFVVRPKSSRRLEVSASAKQGSKRVVVRLRRGAIRLTGKVGQAVRNGKTRKLRLRVVTVDTGGQKFVSVRDCQGQAQVGGEMMPRVSRTSLIVGALVLACLAVPGAASATVTVTQLQDHLGPAGTRHAARAMARRHSKRARSECRLVLHVRIHRREPRTSRRR